MQFIRNNIQKIFIGIIIIVVLAVVLLRGDQLKELINTMKEASIFPLIGAFLIKMLQFVFQSISYHFTFKAVGANMSQKATLPLVFGTFFMNTIAPSMNLAGTTLVVNEANKRGIDPGRATGAALLYQICYDGSFCTIMVISFTMLFFTVGLNPLWIAMGLLVVFLVVALISFLLVSNKKPELVNWILQKIEYLINKFLAIFKQKPLKPWAKNITKKFNDATNMIGKNRKYLLFSYLVSLCSTLCELTCFCLVGVSFSVYSAEPLICGFVVATLFAMISITPQGVGVVEAMIVVAFTMYNQNVAAATAIGITYRGIVFWIPFIIGAILMTQLNSFKGETKQGVKEVVEQRERIRNDRELDIDILFKKDSNIEDKPKVVLDDYGRSIIDDANKEKSKK